MDVLILVLIAFKYTMHVIAIAQLTMYICMYIHLIISKNGNIVKRMGTKLISITDQIYMFMYGPDEEIAHKILDT